jgi:predicted glycogen debranching enzyme
VGKPVEINALWYSAQLVMSDFAKQLGKDPSRYDVLAARALAGFDRFWNAAAGYCFDVLDGPGGNEALLRPNQLLAVSLRESPLSAARQKAVVEDCSGALLTSYGLRSLAPSDGAFFGIYTGDQNRREAAYHQGTVSAWLLGPFVEAHLRVFHDAPAAMRHERPPSVRRPGYGKRDLRWVGPVRTEGLYRAGVERGRDPALL